MYSLVTACMNRESHLRQSLPAWLRLDCVGEVIIVDWSTRESIRDLVELDPRVRVLRVEGESHWTLSYAFNFGISHATGPDILKCDADCLPGAGIAQWTPTAGAFAAGHWRSGRAVGKASVNGQCVFSRAQFEAVNGYSELIRNYGADDSDFYHRLELAGFARREILPDTLSFLDHTQEARLANQQSTGGDDWLEAFLRGQPLYHEMINVFVSQVMGWGPWFPRAPFREEERSGRFSVHRRDAAREIPLTGDLLRLARVHALKAVTADVCKLTGAAAARLDEASCRALLKPRLLKSA